MMALGQVRVDISASSVQLCYEEAPMYRRAEKNM